MENKKVIIFLSILIYLSSTYFSYSFFKKEVQVKIHSPISNIETPIKNSKDEEGDNQEPKTEACPLNGHLFSQRKKDIWEKKRPLGVMIENHTEARPQSGLTSADIIYEAVAEGGITRFLAIFYCQDAKYIGPIRSARIYFIDFLGEYGSYPLYAHVGGANTPGPADALGEIRKMGWSNYNDLDQFGIAFPYYWQDYERLPDRATEHTMYSSTVKLWEFAKNKRKLSDVDEKNKKWNENFTPWKFKDEQPVNQPLDKISLYFWKNQPDYAVKWQYDKKSNSFKRFHNNQPHNDKNNNKQIEVKNLIVAFMTESVANDGYENGQHLLYQTTGQGKAIVFQDGQAIKGKWIKKDRFSRMKFYRLNNEEIALNRGQIFIEIIPEGNDIIY